MNVLSLFDGMSCGQIALDELNIDVKNYYASEINKYAIKVTQHNYPNTKQIGDIKKLTKEKLDKLPKIDLIIGGSPCKDLSIAMKNRKGLRGPKSSLFFEYIRILEYINPKYFLLENVGRIRQSDKDVITHFLGVEPIKINSKLVAPALRGRLYWTNIEVDGKPKKVENNLSANLDKGYTDRKKSRAILASDSRPLRTPVKMFHRYYNTGFTTLIFKNKQHYLDCVEHYDTNYSDKSAREIECNSDIYDGVRYLNQRELERMQTVPEGYTDILTRNQAAKVLGNGWTVGVIKHIVKRISKKKIVAEKKTLNISKI